VSPRGRGPAPRGRGRRTHDAREGGAGAGRDGRAAPGVVRDQLVAILDRRGRHLTAEPFFERGGRTVVDRARDARPGDLVLLHTAHRTRGHARIARVIGRPDNAGAVLEALMLDRGLQRRFPPGVDLAAREARDAGRAGALDDAGGAVRRDLTGLPTFTIDPPTARDYDDAISAEALGEDHWRVWVHIADVSAFVAPGSPVDREAYRRATSVYVPGRVEPMLPEALSNDACSLRPGVDRLAVTVELELRGADVVRSAFTRSTIRSDERLDYPRVDRVFAGREQAGAPWAEPLAAARAAARALAARRERRGALAIESSEPEFAFDRRGHVTGATASEQTESHRLIEHLMISANEAVATLLSDRRIPALYRVHERPDPQAVERLADQLASLGVATPPLREHMSAEQAAEAVAEISQRIEQHVRRAGRGRAALTSLLLRSLKQAHYTPHNLGHAGLGSPRYCHFTSPIRRYPDLICHRALLSAIGGAEGPPPAGAMEEAGVWCSARERDAMSIERKADDVARCFLLERELFEQGGGGTERAWDGEVIGLIGAGAFVAFGDGHEGMLPVRRMRGDWWELNEQGTILAGAETGRTLRLGDPVRVSVHRIDAPRGRVDLDLAA
jgi:ribonuclease R